MIMTSFISFSQTTTSPGSYFSNTEGAILSHIFILGIEVKADGGQLFIYAFVILIACMLLLLQNGSPLSFLLQQFSNKTTVTQP